jgi:hypothetical protein
VALLEKRRFLYNHSGDFPQVILIVPSHVPNRGQLQHDNRNRWINRWPVSQLIRKWKSSVQCLFDGKARYSVSVMEKLGTCSVSLKVFEANFSTTTATDRLVSQLILMSSVQKYFNFDTYIACGIPEVKDK